MIGLRPVVELMYMDFALMASDQISNQAAMLRYRAKYQKEKDPARYEELRLLARAVFVVDREGVIRYTQRVKEVTTEPDYSAVLEAVKGLV